MADLAELTLQVNSAGVAQATLRMNDMNKAGAASEKQAAAFSAGWGSSLGILTKLAAGISGVTLAWKALDAASNRQNQLDSFTALTGSAEKALKIVQDLRNLSDRIPFHLDGLDEAARLLVSLGTSANDAARDVAALADAAAATGRGAPAMHLLASELGRIREQGEVSNRELRVFVRNGVPIWDFISQKLGVDIPEAMKRARTGVLNAEVIYDAVIEGMEQKFGGAAEKRTKTFTGAWEVAKNRITNILADIGESFNKGVDWEVIFNKVTNALRVAGQVGSDAIRIFLGYPAVFGDTASASEKLAGALKIVLEIFKIWVAINIVVMLEKMALNAILFARSMNSASIATRPLLSTVLAVGVALASWSLGKTLFEQFKEVQIAAENLRFTVIEKVTADLGAAGTRQDLSRYMGSGTTLEGAAAKLAQEQLSNEARARGIRPTTQPTDGGWELQQRINEILTSARGGDASFAQKVHDQRLQEIENEFQNGGPSGTFTDRLKANSKESLDALSEGVDAAFAKFTGGNTGALAEELHKLTEAYEQLTDSRNKSTQSTDDDAAAQKRQLGPVNAILEQLQRERKYLGLTNFEKERAQLVDKAAHLLDGTKIADKQKYIDLVRKEVELNARLQAEREIGRAVANRTRDAQLFGLHGDDLEKEAEYRSLINKYIEEGIPLDDKFLAGIKAQSNALTDLKQHWDSVWKLADQVGSAFGNAFDDAITGTKDLKTAFGDMIKEIEKDVIHAFVTQPLSNSLTQAFGQALGSSTTGNSNSGFNFGSILGSFFGGAAHSAKGNVFNQPGISTFGEEGPEAIAPLFRGSDGNLGVKVQGGGSTTIVHMTVYAKDAGSFNKSSRQITDAIKRGI